MINNNSSCASFWMIKASQITSKAPVATYTTVKIELLTTQNTKILGTYIGTWRINIFLVKIWPDDEGFHSYIVDNNWHTKDTKEVVWFLIPDKHCKDLEYTSGLCLYSFPPPTSEITQTKSSYMVSSLSIRIIFVVADNFLIYDRCLGRRQQIKKLWLLWINNNLISTRDKKNYNEVNSLIAQQFNNILSAKLISIINYIFYYRSDNQQSC